MISKKRRVLYLVSRENILEPGVLKSQVLDLMGEVAAVDKNVEILVLDLPSLNRFLRYRGRLSEVRQYCRNRRLNLRVVPIIPIGRSVMPVWAIPFFLIQTVPMVIFFVIRYRVQVIHARSYLSALAGLVVKKLLKDIRLVFDTRSLYLQESKTIGGWKETNPNYVFWRWLERALFRNADRVVVQSSKTIEYVKEVFPPAKVSLIPSAVKLDEFQVSTEDRSQRRRGMGIANSFVFVYSGSLGGIHHPEFMAKFYSVVRRFVKNPKFLVATQSDPRLLLDFLKSFGVNDQEVNVLRNPPLADILPLGDVGLHVYDDVPIAPFASSVKMAEYFASGLPIIVTSNMSSLVILLESGKCGVVIDLADSENVRSKMQELVKDREVFKKNALRLAKEYFSVEVCARKYIEIYDEIIQKNRPR